MTKTQIESIVATAVASALTQAQAQATTKAEKPAAKAAKAAKPRETVKPCPRQVQAALYFERRSDVLISQEGSWLWLAGETKPHADILKHIGAVWSPKRQAWYLPYQGEIPTVAKAKGGDK